MSEIMTNFRAVDMPGVAKPAPKAKPVVKPVVTAAPVVIVEPVVEEVLEVSAEEVVLEDSASTEE